MSSFIKYLLEGNIQMDKLCSILLIMSVSKMDKMFLDIIMGATAV